MSWWGKNGPEPEDDNDDDDRRYMENDDDVGYEDHSSDN